MKSPFCHGPFTRAFVLPNGKFRNCCVTDPEIHSTDSNFSNWWYKNSEFEAFRNELSTVNDFPKSCYGCKNIENLGSHSFRTALNKNPIGQSLQHPKEWSVMVGNTCNLACWHCSEHFSSRIESDKKSLGILPENFTSPNKQFNESWASLQQEILQSYNHHDIVSISLLGGEPTYNKIVLNFLEYLYNNNLSHRTRLEITTNGTVSKKIKNIISRKNWHYVYIAVSIDAVGNKAEWLRYGCNWQEIDANIDFYIKETNYVELHYTISILNIKDMPGVIEYAKEKNINLHIQHLNEPKFLSLSAWDGPALALDYADFDNKQLAQYYKLIGANPIPGSYQAVKEYITKLSTVRTPLRMYDPELADIFDQ